MTVLFIMLGLCVLGYFSMRSDNRQEAEENLRKQEVRAAREALEKYGSGVVANLSRRLKTELSDEESSTEKKIVGLREYLSGDDVREALGVSRVELELLRELEPSKNWVALRDLKFRLTAEEEREAGIVAVGRTHEYLVNPPPDSRSMGGMTSNDLLEGQRSYPMLRTMANRDLVEVEAREIAQEIYVSARITQHGRSICNFLVAFGLGHRPTKKVFEADDEWRKLAERIRPGYGSMLDVVHFPVSSDKENAGKFLAGNIQVEIAELAAKFVATDTKSSGNSAAPIAPSLSESSKDKLEEFVADEETLNSVTPPSGTYVCSFANRYLQRLEGNPILRVNFRIHTVTELADPRDVEESPSMGSTMSLVFKLENEFGRISLRKISSTLKVSRGVNNLDEFLKLSDDSGRYAVSIRRARNDGRDGPKYLIALVNFVPL